MTPRTFPRVSEQDQIVPVYQFRAADVRAVSPVLIRKKLLKGAIISTIRISLECMMAHQVLAETTASVSELKRNPMGTIAAGEGFPVAILNRNAPVFYCVPAEVYERMLERLDDIELNAIADARKGQRVIKVTLDEL